MPCFQSSIAFPFPLLVWCYVHDAEPMAGYFRRSAKWAMDRRSSLLRLILAA